LTETVGAGKEEIKTGLESENVTEMREMLVLLYYYKNR
jgi:hypothetical protein